MPGSAGGNGCSFAEVVDRMLADLRQSIVSEHAKRLQTTGSVPKKENATASQFPGAAPEKPVLPAAPFRNQTDGNASIECGTQTQVDWEWPMMAPMTGGPMMPFGWISEAQTGNANTDTHVDLLQEDEDAQKESKSKQNPNVIGLKSDALKARANFGKDRQQSFLLLKAWERILLAGKREPETIVDAVMGVVIFANAVAIGISADTKDWERGWLIVDSVFALIFLFEALMKAYFLGCSKYFCGPDRLWTWFEVALIILSFVELSLAVLATVEDSFVNGTSLFRVFRLVRLTKLLRICRIPMAAELVMMVNGLIGGIRALCWAIVLTMFPLVIFALVMRETLGEETAITDHNQSAAVCFNSLPNAFYTTFRCLVVEDCADETGRPIFVLVTDSFGWAYGFVYSLTVIVMKFGLYNVIIAIFVEQTVEAAKYNEIYQKRSRLNDSIMFQEKSLEMAELAYSLKQNLPADHVALNLSLDEIQALELSNSEFNELCKHPEFKELMIALDVAEEDHLDLFDTLDVDGGGTLDLGEIVSGIAKLRGDARKSDIVAVILLAKHLNRSLSDFKEETTQILESQGRKLKSIEKTLQPLFNAHPASGRKAAASARGNNVKANGQACA